MPKARIPNRNEYIANGIEIRNIKSKMAYYKTSIQLMESRKTFDQEDIDELKTQLAIKQKRYEELRLQQLLFKGELSLDEYEAMEGVQEKTKATVQVEKVLGNGKFLSNKGHKSNGKTKNNN